MSIPLTEKEKAFCQQFARLHNAKEAAVRAGYSINRAQRTADRLLQRREILRRIDREMERFVPQHLEQLLFAGLMRLAFGSANDAAKLAVGHEALSPEQIDRLDLFLVSELKKTKDGGFEVKLHDRIKALGCLEQFLQAHQDSQTADSFFQALEQSVKED